MLLFACYLGWFRICHYRLENGFQWMTDMPGERWGEQKGLIMHFSYEPMGCQSYPLSDAGEWPLALGEFDFSSCSLDGAPHFKTCNPELPLSHLCSVCHQAITSWKPSKGHVISYGGERLWNTIWARLEVGRDVLFIFQGPSICFRWKNYWIWFWHQKYRY